jgi:hypothetical protein
MTTDEARAALTSILETLLELEICRLEGTLRLVRPHPEALFRGQTEDRSEELGPFLKAAFEKARALHRVVGGDCSDNFAASPQPVGIEAPAHGSTAVH